MAPSTQPSPSTKRKAKGSGPATQEVTKAEPQGKKNKAPKPAANGEAAPTVTPKNDDIADVAEAKNESGKKRKRGGNPNPLARKYGHHLHNQGDQEGGEKKAGSTIRKQLRDTRRLLARGVSEI